MEAARLARDLRSTVVEHVHRGHVAVVKGDRLLYAAGDPETIVPLRDGGAPFVAAAFCEAGLDAKIRATPDEIAIMAGRHDGAPEAVDVLRGIMRRLELSEDHLRCPPRTAPLRHGASGRHVALLALARKLGHSPSRYLSPDSPARRRAVDLLLASARLLRSEVTCLDEGDGLPTLAMPLSRIATLWSVLADPGSPLSPPTVQALSHVGRDMRQHADARREGATLWDRLMAVEDGPLGLVTPGGLACMASPRTGWGIALQVESGRSDVAEGIALGLLTRLELFDESAAEEIAKALPKPETGQTRRLELDEVLRRIG